MNRIILSLAIVILFTGCFSTSSTTKQKEQVVSSLVFTSNNQALETSFNWAKETALSFVELDAPVGPWYEAALPGRDAFCMRDVSHQSLAAEYLGLSVCNLNMYQKFAENISASKDFCSYWEINRLNNPAPVDYENDQDFWYNLPANFDIIQSMWKLYAWTGDSTYLLDPDISRFIKLSLDEYVKRWDLEPTDILTRDRKKLSAVSATSSKSRFGNNRGIPTYNEGGRGETILGIDLTASMHSAYSAGMNFAKFWNDKALFDKYAKKLASQDSLIQHFWWDDKVEEFRTIQYDNLEFDYFMVGENQAFSHYLLYFDALSDKEKKIQILENYIAHQDVLIVELASHIASFYYKAGWIEEAHQLIYALCNENNARRDYPEVSFSIINDIVGSYLGISAIAYENTIITNPQFLEGETAMLSNLSVAGIKINFTINDDGSYTLENLSDKALNWNPRFTKLAKSIKVNNLQMNAIYAKDEFDNLYTYLYCNVKPFEKVTVKAIL